MDDRLMAMIKDVDDDSTTAPQRGNTAERTDARRCGLPLRARLHAAEEAQSAAHQAGFGPLPKAEEAAQEDICGSGFEPDFPSGAVKALQQSQFISDAVSGAAHYA